MQPVADPAAFAAADPCGGFLARQRQTQQELRQAAANQSQLQIEPGAQSVWRMLLVVQKEEPAFVLVRADGPAHSVTFCALPGQLAGQRTRLALPHWRNVRFRLGRGGPLNC